ncbi:MAG TPA: ATP-binding protein, partial [Planctomycetaceae bacterium]|nr:ATP-binding protein [Planctomycetaceae bacterium]
DERLAVANPNDELGHLASTFNAMLDRLQGTFTELRQFTADAAHEIRTPLAVIRSAAEVALHSPRSESYYQECLHSIAEDTNRLTTLSDQLLLLAKEDAGLAECPLEDIDLAPLLEQVATDLEPLADEKSVTIIRQKLQSCQVRGDTQRLRRVFLNLVDNAIKFTPAGGEISLCLTGRDNLAVVTVADTGCGIPAPHLPHVFERFYRVDASRDRATGGAGLGLAISRAIIHRHGGEIRVASREGRGTTITVELSATTAKQSLETDCEATPLRTVLVS